MKVTVKLTGYLAHTTIGQTLRGGVMVMPDNAVLADVLDLAGVAADSPLIVALNGNIAARDTPLQDGDLVSVIAPIHGGSSTFEK